MANDTYSCTRNDADVLLECVVNKWYTGACDSGKWVQVDVVTSAASIVNATRVRAESHCTLPSNTAPTYTYKVRQLRTG